MANNTTEANTTAAVDDSTTIADVTSQSPISTSTLNSTPVSTEPNSPLLIACTVSGSVALVIIILAVCLCYRRYRRKGSRPRLPLPSLEVCDTRHSLHDDGTRSNASNEERLFGHGRYGGNTQSGDADAQLYENTTQRKKNSPTPPTPCLTPHYYNVRNNGRKKPTIKPKPRLILGPSKNGGFAKKAQPIGQMSPGQPSYIDILPDSDSGEFGQAYSYVPTQWPPGGNTPRPAPPTRQTSECSMNYYNMPTDSSYQNVETKFQS